MTSAFIPSSTVEAMRCQELSYQCKDYLYQEQHQGGSRSRLIRLQNTPQHSNQIDVACRQSMLQWMQTVVNFIGFDSETVEISMSYLDRFLMTAAGRESMECRTTFQLAAMVALYIAVKIHCAEALTPKLLAELSQGAYEAEEFEHMERIMLEAIKWRVNPPTSIAFVQETLERLPNLFASEDLQQQVHDAARAQVEYAAGDYELMTIKKSVIAFAAISNALKHFDVKFNMKKFLLELSSTKDYSLELDLQHSVLIQQMLRPALPERSASAPASITTTEEAAIVSEDEQDASVKSIDDDDHHHIAASAKRVSAGKSPRSIVYHNVAA